jgi:hypothetical protein
MRIFVFLILVLGCAGICSAQGDSLKITVRNKWCSSKDSVIVYERGFNVIQVYGKDIDPKKITIRSLSSKLRVDLTEVKGDTAQTIAMPMDVDDVMKLAVVDRKSGRLLKEVRVYGDTLPEPRAILGNKIRGGIVDKKAVLDESYIKVYHHNSSYCYPYRVLRYTFKAKKGNVPMEKQVIGLEIPVDVKQLIKDLPLNGVAEFTDIIAVCPECNERKLKNIKLVVK